MKSKLHLQLVTPENMVLEKELESLTCPTTLGQITILPGHIPLVANLMPGELIAKNGNDISNIYVSGGFVEVRPNNQIVILSDAAEHAHALSEKEAQEARERAQKMLKEKNLSDVEYAKAAAALEQSLARMRIARKRSHQRSSPVTGEGILGE